MSISEGTPTLFLPVKAHDTLDDTIRRAITLAKQYGPCTRDEEGITVLFTMCDVRVSVKSDSDPALIKRDWGRAVAGFIPETVLPYPAAELSDNEQRDDAHIGAFNQQRYEQWVAEHSLKLTMVAETLHGKLANAPRMQFEDEPEWHFLQLINQGCYGKAILALSEQWARLMQLEMTQELSLSSVAQPTLNELDTAYGLGIRAFYDMVDMLARTWQYGEQLRQWHNQQYGFAEDYEGVVDPTTINKTP